MSDNTNINYLLEKARNYTMSSEQAEEQRRSFAYGNTALENPKITREDIDRAAEKLAERRNR